MQINKSKINKIIEIIILIIMFFIGIRKGGYYKADSLPLIFLVVFFGLIYLLLNIRDIKKNSIVFLFLIILAMSYAIPIFIGNAATISGAINFTIKVSSLSIIYMIFSNSENKKDIRKWVIITTFIFGILAIDELTYRVLDSILKVLGGGYVSDNNGRIAGVMQYSNVLALMCLISIIFVVYNLLENKKTISLKKALITFFTLILTLTESKLVFLLYILTFIIYAIKNKRYSSIFEWILNLFFCIIISSFMILYNVIIVSLIACILLCLYLYLNHKLKNNYKLKYIIDVVIFCVIIVLGALVIFKENVGIIKSVKTYFNNFNSTKLRIIYYIDTIKLITKTPLNLIFGMGGNAFRTMYETVQETEYISLETHSAILQIFIESGVFGVVSILTIIIYTLNKAKNNGAKLAFFVTVIFMCFDVFFTYTFMMYMFVMLISLLELRSTSVRKVYKLLYLLLCFCLNTVVIIQFIAYMYMPTTIGDLNNTLDKQKEILNKMEIALAFDPYDLEYIRAYTQGLNIYIEILNTKEELYGVDNSLEKLDAISRVYNNVKKENSYEKSNKYTIEDYVYYVYKYIDKIVLLNYSENINWGYELYLKDMLSNLEKLYIEHSHNEYAVDIYKEYLNLIYSKYIYVNTMLNNVNITNILNGLKENEYISL